MNPAILSGAFLYLVLLLLCVSNKNVSTGLDEKWTGGGWPSLSLGKPLRFMLL